MADQSAKDGWLETLDARLDSLPSWARPPFYGMFVVYGFMLAKAMYLWPFLLLGLLLDGPEGLLEALWVLIAAGLAGFAGGLAFAVVRPATRWLGKPGAFITGWLTVFTYAAVVLPAVSPDGPDERYYFDSRDPIEWLIVAILSMIFGSVVGAFLIDMGPKAKRRWTQKKQRMTGGPKPPAN